ncbi:hypothetical protein [Sphingobacterium bambusae]|uniref:Uncharacterized protein n=1 Tax=Sphingobacterium bambusae TaxID=662858 RepID=A0ABW6BAL4_9SPHI|nr:hypothetical protein [Sphingobacterium bambusae]WPL48275.1 hypothetical protein SCB77_20210 [Sphingobacterium bambusae]
MRRTNIHHPAIIALMMTGQGAHDESSKTKANDPEKPNELDKFPKEGEEIENLPPVQPDVDPLERENPDLDEWEENEELDIDDEDLEKEAAIEQHIPQGQTIVVDRRMGKDEL